ncbi:hypothetical protein PMAYCL1PPCAC_08567, partial [Pristionchus mayeri]
QGSTCDAAAHAVVLALQELLRHPDDLDANWRIETCCRYLFEAIQTGFSAATMCSVCGSIGDPAQAETVRRLIARFPRPVQIIIIAVADEPVL